LVMEENKDYYPISF